MAATLQPITATLTQSILYPQEFGQPYEVVFEVFDAALQRYVKTLVHWQYAFEFADAHPGCSVWGFWWHHYREIGKDEYFTYGGGLYDSKTGQLAQIYVGGSRRIVLERKPK